MKPSRIPLHENTKDELEKLGLVTPLLLILIIYLTHLKKFQMKIIDQYIQFIYRRNQLLYYFIDYVQLFMKLQQKKLFFQINPNKPLINITYHGFETRLSEILMCPIYPNTIIRTEARTPNSLAKWFPAREICIFVSENSRYQ